MNADDLILELSEKLGQKKPSVSKGLIARIYSTVTGLALERAEFERQIAEKDRQFSELSKAYADVIKDRTYERVKAEAEAKGKGDSRTEDVVVEDGGKWYWHDEAWNRSNPCETREEAVDALNRYLRDELDSPTASVVP